MHDSLTQINQAHKCTKYMKSSRSVLTISFKIHRQILYLENVKNALLYARETAIGSIRDLRWVGDCQGQEIQSKATLKFTKVLQVPNNQDVPPFQKVDAVQFRGDLMFFSRPLFF